MRRISLHNETDFTPDTERMEEIAKALGVEAVELLLTDAEGIRRLNRDFRNKDASTDVLSFPTADIGHPDLNLPLGSIAINVERAHEASQRFGHTPQEEALLLFVHGLLHLLGYDHESDEGQMRTKEKEIIETFGLPQSLIVRTEENSD